MNEFISPHQNININISYNLAQSQEKVPKVIFGRKVPKIIKARCKDPDPELKNPRRTDFYFSKPDDKKPSAAKPPQPLRKKQNNFTTSTDEIVIPRRLKTEGNFNSEIVASTTCKKESKTSTKNFSKSVWHNKSSTKQSTGLIKSVPVKKPAVKSKKETPKNRNSSCMLYASKKHVMSDIDHVMSLVTEPKVQARKRASSASVIREDKFIGKLVNMSILGSEMGGSIPMHENSAKSNPRFRSNLQDFMNSLDVRVLKCMKKDQASTQNKSVLADLMVGEGLELITYLNKIKRIPMERLNQSATVIQRFWREKAKESILPYYRDLFRNASLGMQTMHTEDISGIDIEVRSSSAYEEDPKTVFDEQEVAKNACEGIDLLKKYKMSEDEEIADENESFFSDSLEEDPREQEDPRAEEEEYNSSEGRLEEAEQKSLNIKKYQQLVRKTIQKSKFNAGGKPAAEQTHSVHWNVVHNILTTNINQKTNMSNTVLQELMRQSAYNKQWVEGEFSSDSRKMSSKESPRDNQFASREKEAEAVAESPEAREGEGGANEEVDLDEYNWSKYSDIRDLKKPHSVAQFSQPLQYELPSGLNTHKQMPNAYRDNSKSNSSYEEDSSQEFQDGSDEKQHQEDTIVNNYLDCGLDNFGLNMMAKLEKEARREAVEEEKKEHEGVLRRGEAGRKCSDEDLLFSNSGEEHEEERVFVFRNEENGRKNTRDDINQHLDNREHQTNLDYQEGSKEEAGGMAEIMGVMQFNTSEEEAITEAINQELNNKRVDKVTEEIVGILLEEFAKDVSNILRKSQNSNLLNQESMSARSSRQVQPLNPIPGIVTNFQTIRDFITKLKVYILESQEHVEKIISNLGNNIGPTSAQILSYLRVEEEEQIEEEAEQNRVVANQQEQEEDTEEWLFVVPNELFEKFNKDLIQEEERMRGRKLSNRLKLYSQFWHRSIFECFNECLDYERPFGITGAPYAWITEAKIARQISLGQISEILNNAENRLLQLSCASSGIIFDKPDSPYRDFSLGEEARNQLNEERISRMLANEILDDEYNWITYNDELTELMVDISRRLEEMLIFQVATDLKKMSRRRRLIPQINEDVSWDDQQVVFQLQQL